MHIDRGQMVSNPNRQPNASVFDETQQSTFFGSLHKRWM